MKIKSLAVGLVWLVAPNQEFLFFHVAVDINRQVICTALKEAGHWVGL